MGKFSFLLLIGCTYCRECLRNFVTLCWRAILLPWRIWLFFLWLLGKFFFLCCAVSFSWPCVELALGVG